MSVEPSSPNILNRRMYLDILIGIIVIGFIIFALLFVLNEFSVFKMCDGKEDYENVTFNDVEYNCGELKVVNTSLSGVTNKGSGT